MHPSAGKAGRAMAAAPADLADEAAVISELRASSGATIASLRMALSAAESLARSPSDSDTAELLGELRAAYATAARVLQRDLSELDTARARAHVRHNRSRSLLLSTLPDELGAHVLSHASLRTHCASRLACRALRRWSRASEAMVERLSTRMLERTSRTSASLSSVLRHVDAHFSALTHLELHRCDQLEDGHLKLLPPGVRVLNLFGCTEIGARGVKLAVTRCPGLEEIILRCCHRVDNHAVQYIAVHCASLQGLSLSGCVRVTDEGVAALASCTQLRRLGVHQCVRVTHACIVVLSRAARLDCIDLGRTHPAAHDAGLAPLWSRCTSLRWLNLQGLPRLTDATLEAIASQCGALERLVCGACVRITVAGISAVCQRCTHLEWLHMRDLVDVTDSWLLVIARLCAQLASLDVRGCARLTNGGVEEFFNVRRRYFPASNPVRIELLADDPIASYAHVAARLKPRRDNADCGIYSASVSS